MHYENDEKTDILNANIFPTNIYIDFYQIKKEITKEINLIKEFSIIIHFNEIDYLKASIFAVNETTKDTEGHKENYLYKTTKGTEV